MGTVALKLDKMCILARKVGLLLFTELVSRIICTIFYKKSDRRSSEMIARNIIMNKANASIKVR